MDQKIDLREILVKAFPGIPPAQAEDLFSMSEMRAYPVDTVLCHEGAQETTFFILLEGEVRVTKRFDDTEERLLKHLHPGDFFGEMAIINNAPRAAKVVSTCPVVVLEICKETFDNLLQKSSYLTIALMREVNQRQRENDEMAINDLRQKAAELAEAYHQLSTLEQDRREFLTTIAHELRTPLMVANGFLQVIRSGMLQAVALNSTLDTIQRNMQEITSLTNDFLCLQEMDLILLQEMDLILPEFRPTDIDAVVALVVEQLHSRAEQNKVSLQLSIDPILPQVPADAKSLSRAIVPVLDNAIKFSPGPKE